MEKSGLGDLMKLCLKVCYLFINTMKTFSDSSLVSYLGDLTTIFDESDAQQWLESLLGD